MMPVGTAQTLPAPAGPERRNFKGGTGVEPGSTSPGPLLRKEERAFSFPIVPPLRTPRSRPVSPHANERTAFSV